MNIVIDDALLFAVLTNRTQEALDRPSGAFVEEEIFTTSSWYYRLSRAVAHGSQGALSRPFRELEATEQGRVVSRLAVLPSGIGFVETRVLVPTMAALPGQTSFLNTEAVAAAIVTDSKIVVTTQSQALNDLARAVGVEVEFVR